MRKFILALLLISAAGMLRAGEDETKLTVKLLIKDSGRMYACRNSAPERCLLSGAFLTPAQGDPQLYDGGGDLNIFLHPWIFGEALMSNFLTNKKNLADSAISLRKFDIESITPEKPEFKEIVQFSFEAVPLDRRDDSVAVFFKYIVYDLIRENSRLDFNYNIKLFHKMLIIPFNKAVEPAFLKEIFGGRSTTLTVLKYDKALAAKYSEFMTNYFTEMNESVKSSVMNGNKINLGLEFIRSDQKNENILLRQLKYPLDSSNVLCDATTEVVYKIPFSLYKCRFPVVYSTEKKGTVKINYNIFIVPLKLEKNELKCDMFIEYNNYGGLQTPLLIRKTLTIYKGEKIKIEILGSDRRIGEYISQYLTREPQGLKSLFSSMNEYFVLSFEFAE